MVQYTMYIYVCGIFAVHGVLTPFQQNCVKIVLHTKSITEANYD